MTDMICSAFFEESENGGFSSWPPHIDHYNDYRQ